MAIKVKHEGSAASRLAAGAAGGAAKRAMEAAQLVKPTQIQSLAPAHASAPSAGGAHAQLISAPGGGAHAPLVGGGGGIGSRLSGPAALRRAADLGGSVRRAAGTAGMADSDYKVTGTSIFDRPDEESQWDYGNGGRWIRKWLPGEKEAEAQQRIGDVKNAQAMQMFDFKLSTEQKNEIAKINGAIEDARRSGRFTDDELADLKRQAQTKLLGIRPLPTPREKDAQRSFEERLVTVGGVQGYINAHGDFAPIEKDDGFANFLKVYPKLAEYTEDETITDPATGKTNTVPVTKTRTAEEIARLVADAQAAWRKVKNPSAYPQQPAAAAPSEDEQWIQDHLSKAGAQELDKRKKKWAAFKD